MSENMTEAEIMMLSNINEMKWENGFDVIIVCCSSGQQARYWQRRLDENRGTLLPSNCIVLAVKEDWPGGAGNALGTLYAYKNAVSLANERYGLNIDKSLEDGSISIGLYHTAGKGTRLAPLPGAENNNKPGVKLPSTIKCGGKLVPMTILEAVIKQTSTYARSRPGRLSVFWGDQVFIPTVPIQYNVTHHADILCSLGPMPSEQDWKDKGMDKYGLIAQSENGDSAQVDKVDHATAISLLSGLGQIVGVGVSLGSFSISSYLLFGLLEEFKDELENRRGKLDSDPHLWMPMTLKKDDYIKLMLQKDFSVEVSSQHYDRIQKFLSQFFNNEIVQNSKLSNKLFGAVTVGQGVYWWDYGQLKLYQRNALLMADTTTESALMRKFFGLSDTSRIRDSSIIKTSIDNTSCISSSHLGNQGSKGSCGNVKRSVLCNVRCKYIDAEDSILIGVTADRIYARPGCIIYNIIDESEEGLDLNHGQILAGVFSDDGTQLIMRSTTTIDGGKVWQKELEWNPKTFEDIYNMNANADPLKIEKQSLTAHSSKWKSLTRNARNESVDGEETPVKKSTSSNSQSIQQQYQQQQQQQQQSNGSGVTDNVTVATILAARDQELMNASRAYSSFWTGYAMGTLVTLGTLALGSSIVFTWLILKKR
mmetsp:Transcript_12720/g.13148  ORF Transcript_12720/g.13148 Transcript_12720/m.13148 type:complete len:650 (-) Transcript_12720:75-2024(-)